MNLNWIKKFNILVKKGKNDDQKKDASFDPQLLSMDFYSQLVYMSAIATSGIARDKLVYYAARLPFIAARYFRKVDFVAKMFNHDYPQACRIVGEKTNEPEVKAFLLRLSSALSSGEDVSGFLSRESQIFAESYGNNYERRLDLLKKWGDAYVSLIMTTALVTVMSVVSMMIGNVTITFIVGSIRGDYHSLLFRFLVSIQNRPPGSEKSFPGLPFEGARIGQEFDQSPLADRD